MNDSMIGYAGVDWAMDGHAVCVVNGHGTAVIEFDVEHSAEGLSEMCRRIAGTGARRVAIERPDGPVVDALLGAGLEVVVVSSRSVKALRERYGTSGNKSDRSDAFVLADCLRTDGHRWRSLEPDSPATVTLRGHVRARKDLVETRVAVANQLRAHLRIVFPGAVGLFSAIDRPIALRFLERFPSATSAGWLSEKRLATWLRANSYSGSKDPAELYTRLSAAPAGVIGVDGDARGAITLAYVKVLKTLRTQIDELNTRLDELLDAHPDAPIFRSLPRCATVRAATLLAEIGDCRARFPDPESLVLPRRSRPIHQSQRPTPRRHLPVVSSDTKLREAICDFAGDSWRGNAWAAHRYHELRASGKTHPHAERILARSWTHIIWRCWQDNTTYDPTRHGAHQRLTTQTA